MGIFDKIRKVLTGASKTGEFNDIGQECMNEMISGADKETFDVTDSILKMYKGKTDIDVQNELMKKYMKISLNDLEMQKTIRRQEIQEEVEESLDGVDAKTSEEITQDVIENEEKGEIKPKNKDEKQEIKGKIYETAYKKMYDEYTSRVLKIKSNQFYDRAISVGTNEAIEMLGYEKCLEKLEVRYNKVSNKTLSQNKEIDNKRKEFKDNFEYIQKGTNSNADKRVEEINLLYSIRDEKYRKYIDALADKSKSPYEISMYKEAYEEANINLIQNVPSLSEYTKDLDIQSKNMRIAKDKGLDDSSAINNRIDTRDISDKDHDVESLEQSKMAQNIDKSSIKRENMEARNLDYVNNSIENQAEKGDLESMQRAEQMTDAKEASDKYRENIDDLSSRRSKVQAEKDVDKEENENNLDFINSLKQYNDDEMTEEKAKRILEENVKDRNARENRDTIQKNNQSEMERIRRKKNNSQF